MTRSERLVYRLLMVLGVTALIIFYVWWFRPEHIPENFTGAWRLVDVAIFLSLTGVLSLRIFMDVYVWVVARKIQPRQAAPEPEPGLRVAFITTFVPGAEGLELLMRTLPAMLEADYPHDVWLLDEGADDAARELCQNLGVNYFTRSGRREYNLVAGPFTARTKGGNHNSWYDSHGHQYDVVAQIDTDFLPRRDFLTSTLGYLRDPKVGWVTTPQIYGNTDNLVSLGAAQQQYTFYGPVLRGLAGRGIANMLGANHVVRVAALDEIGLYAGHVTEDLLTGMRLHARGWRSLYVPRELATGEGPENWKAYFNQQMRWAYGCIHVLRYHTATLTSSMQRSWRLLYVSLQQGYFSGVTGAVGTALLVAYFIGGVQISGMTLIGLLIWATPLFLMRQVIRFWMQRFSVRPDRERGIHLAGAVVSIACWPIYFLALVRVLRQQPLAFKVTPKGKLSRRRSGESPQRLFIPHLVVATASLACLVVGFATGRDAAILVFWAAANVVTMGGLFFFAGLAERPIRRAAQQPASADSEFTVVA